MKFLVLLLATAALATGSILGRKNVDIKEDGTILIRGEDGKQIIISKQYGPYGQNDIEIEVTGPNTITKKIQIDNNNRVNIEKGVEYQIPESYDDVRSYDQYRYRRSAVESQDDVLAQILREYQGVVDEASYQQLLSKVQKAVLKGKISKNVLNFLQALNEESSWNSLVSGRTEQGLTGIYGQGVRGIYGQGLNGLYGQGIYGQSKYSQLLNKLFYKQKYSQGINGIEGLTGEQSIFERQGVYGKNYVQQFLSQVLLRIFDERVLVTYFAQQGIFEQGLTNQYLTEQVLDMILSQQGIFDYKVLIELVNNPTLRNILVQEGIFDEKVLEELVYIYKTKGIYETSHLENLVNRQVLKYWLVKEGIFNTYFLGNTVYNREIYTQQLVQLVKNQVLRNMLVQQGIFNREVLEQFLYLLNTQGIISESLLQRLINKSVVRSLLIQQGIVDETILERLVDNEVLGLNVLLKVLYQQTPRMSYRQLVGQYMPYGEDLVGINIEKTIVRPVKQGLSYGNQWTSGSGLLNNLLYGNSDNLYGQSYLRNIIYGQQGRLPIREYGQGYVQGRQGLYTQLPIVQQPIV